MALDLPMNRGIVIPAEIGNTVPPPIGCRLALFQVARKGHPEKHEGNQKGNEGYGPFHDAMSGSGGRKQRFRLPEGGQV
jgi:hypothetical protein